MSMGNGRELTEETQTSEDLGIIVRSAAMEGLLRNMRKVAPSIEPVVLTGATGTGKEILAKALHTYSGRSGSFVPVNCGAIPQELAESLLFGHKKGAFTNAYADQRGYVEEAHAGTLFLDEVDSLPLPLQVKLLRTLQEQEVVRIGEQKPRPVDARVVAATPTPLDELVQAGTFREDLYYRLNVLPFTIPSLHERGPVAIQALAEHFYQKAHAANDSPLQGISPEAMDLLVNHDWPGNVRQLENAIRRACVMAEGTTLQASDFAFDQPSFALDDQTLTKAVEFLGTFRAFHPRYLAGGYTEMLHAFTADYFTWGLAMQKGSLGKAGRFMGVEKTTVYQRISMHDIPWNTIKESPQDFLHFDPGFSFTLHDGDLVRLLGDQMGDHRYAQRYKDLAYGYLAGNREWSTVKGQFRVFYLKAQLLKHGCDRSRAQEASKMGRDHFSGELSKRGIVASDLRTQSHLYLPL